MGGPGSGRPKGQRNYTEAEQKAWARMYASGMSLGEITVKTGIGRSAVNRGVRRWTTIRPTGGARKAGTGLRHKYIRTRDPERAEKMRVMYCEQGMTLQAIGDQYGLTRERVHQILRGNGIDTTAVRGERAEAAEARRIERKTKTCPTCGERVPPFQQRTHRRDAGHPPRYGTRTDMGLRYGEIVFDYEAGMLDRDIMAKYGITQSAISRALISRGLRRHRRSINRLPTMAESRARMDAIVADYQAEELLAEEIGIKHGVSEAMVSLVLRNRGVARNSSEGLKRRGRIQRYRRQHQLPKKLYVR